MAIIATIKKNPKLALTNHWTSTEILRNRESVTKRCLSLPIGVNDSCRVHGCFNIDDEFRNLKSSTKRTKTEGWGLKSIQSYNWSDEGDRGFFATPPAGKVGQTVTIDIKGKLSLIHFLIEVLAFGFILKRQKGRFDVLWIFNLVSVLKYLSCLNHLHFSNFWTLNLNYFSKKCLCCYLIYLNDIIPL